MSRHLLLTLAAFCVLSLGALTASAQEQFSLEVPGDPSLKSSAVVTARGLTITDAAGIRHVYAVKPEIDAPNGAYLGFYNAESRQFLRWPAAGEGAMYTGTAALGGEIAWKKSLMQVKRIGRPRDPLGVPDPFGERRPVVGRDPLDPRDPRGGAGRVGPLNLAVLPDRGGTFTVAHVDETGALRFYEGRDGRWKPVPSDLREKLPPGAPLVLVRDRAGGLPIVFTVSDRGELVEISEGSRLRIVSRRGDPRFIPQTHLVLLGGRTTQLAGVDERGQLWQIDVERSAYSEIEARGGIFEPGIPLAVDTPGAAQALFLIDRRGNILRYTMDLGRWSAPDFVAGGFASGGSVAGLFGSPAVGRPETTLVASVDNAGRGHIFAEIGGAFADEVLRDARFAPGTPVGLASDATGLAFSAIGNDGSWQEWRRRGQTWVPRDIADGFPTGAMVLLAQPGPAAFAIDRTGRLIASRLLNGAWETAILSPKFAFAPRLVRRAIVPNEPLPPVTVEFENKHKEELVLRVHSPIGARPIELSILPGKSALQKIERDAGATLEEVYLLAGPRGELVEEVHRVPLPPKKLYDVVVYANRVTSVYFDRTKGKKSTVPDESSLSLVSLGVFPIPPGELVRDGERFDVFREANAQRNPGAAALLDGNPGGK